MLALSDTDFVNFKLTVAGVGRTTQPRETRIRLSSAIMSVTTTP